MSVYMLIDITVKDPEKMREYATKVPYFVEKHGGHFLAKATEVTTMHGTWKPERLIVIEFPSKENIDEWYASEEYKPYALLRDEAADMQIIVLPGC